MTLYYLERGGIGYLPHNLFLELDKSLSKGAPSFNERFPLHADGFKQLFLGEQNCAYDYLLESGIPFFLVTHPQVTFSCQDKVDMYNKTGCRTNGAMSGGEEWQLPDTVKSVYFYDKTTERYHIAIIPGKPTGIHIDQEQSFKAVCSGLGISIKKRIRTFPADDRPIFGTGLEGHLSPLIPDYFRVGREIHFTEDSIDAIYFDETALSGHSGKTTKLDDLSISLSPISLEGGHIEKTIGLSHIGSLRQIIGSQPVPLEIARHGRRRVVHVDGLVRGDYRDATTKPKLLERKVTLRFSYIPNPMLSMLMSYYSLYELLKSRFHGKVVSVDMRYY